MNFGKNNKISSFTLVELLIVIAILAILAAAVVIVLNPAELLAQSRDSQRISDVNMMKKAVDLFIVDNSVASLGTANRVYISLPDSSSSCLNITGLPTLPATWQYVCAPVASLRNTDGTGWLPLNFSLVKGGSPIPYLPIDPQNDPSLTKYYQYIPGTNTFELTALMESEKQAKAAGKDGGTDAGRLEVGSSMSLWRTASGISAYWRFDGASGSVINNGQVTGLEDLSGNGNNATATNANGLGMSFTDGRLGSAVQFDGVDDALSAPSSPSLVFGTNSFSYGLWYYGTQSTSAYDMPIYKGGGSLANPGYDMELGTGGWAAGFTDGVIAKNISLGPEVLNQWKHLVVVCDRTAGNIYTYVDGVRYAQTAIAPLGSVTSAVPVAISHSSYKIKGMIDEIAVFNRVLSEPEVKSWYNATK